MDLQKNINNFEFFKLRVLHQLCRIKDYIISLWARGPWLTLPPPPISPGLIGLASSDPEEAHDEQTVKLAAAVVTS